MEVGGEGVLYTVRYFQVKWLWQQIPFNIILVDNTCTVLIESKPEYSIEPIIFGYIAKKNRHYSN